MEWYYSQNQQQLGPISEASLRELLAQGTLRPDTLIWKVGLPEWVPAHTGLPLQDTPQEEQEICGYCKLLRPVSDMANLQEQRICSTCMPKAVQTLREGQPLSAPSAGVRAWKEGKLLVTLDQTELPKRCIHCNAPAKNMSRRRLFWHHPAWYLLIFVNLLVYVIVAMIIRRKSTLDIGLCQQHTSQRRWFITLGWLSFILGMVGGGFLLAYELPSVAIGIILAGLVGTFIFAALGRLVVIKRIDPDGTTYLAKISPAYLDSL